MAEENRKSLKARIVGLFYEKKFNEKLRHMFTRFGRMRIHDLGDPQAARQVHKDIETFQTPGFVRKTLAKLIGGAMIIEEGENWRVLHDIMADSFSPKRVNSHIAPIVMQETGKMIDLWREKKDIPDVEQEMLHVTGRIIMRAIFSDTMNERDSGELLGIARRTLGAPKPTKLTKVMRYFGLAYDHAGFMVSAVLRAVGISRNFAPDIPKHYKKAKKEIDEILYRNIRERRQLPEQPDDILGALIRARKPDGKGLTDTEVRDQALMLIIAGHETTAESLTFALKEIIKQPDTQKKLRDEFRAVTQGRPLTGAHYGKLVEAQNALKETMRLHPPLYMSTREATAGKIVCSHAVEEHDLVRIDLRDLHMNEEFFPDAKTFKPERFDKGAGGGKHPAYMPFGVGQRVCIGMNMAMVEGTLFLSEIFNKLNMEMVKEPQGEKYFFTTRPDSEMAVRVGARAPSQLSS